MAIDKGDLVRVTGAFTNTAGAAIDPTTVTFSFRINAGATVTYVYPTTVVKDAVGNYHVDIDANASGTFHYRWAGSGAVGQGADESYFEVKSSMFA